MTALAVSILRLNGVIVVDSEQGVEAIDDLLGCFRLIVDTVQGTLLGLFDSGCRLDFGRIVVKSATASRYWRVRICNKARL